MTTIKMFAVLKRNGTPRKGTIREKRPIMMCGCADLRYKPITLTLGTSRAKRPNPKKNIKRYVS